MNAPKDARFAQLELKDSKLFRQQCYIDGAWLDADDKSTIAVKNPADGICTFGLAKNNLGCDHLSWPHLDHLIWPRLASSNGGVHQFCSGGLEPGPYGKEVKGGTVRRDSQGEQRDGESIDT